MSVHRSASVVVVGAGAAGLAVALQLSQGGGRRRARGRSQRVAGNGIDEPRQRRRARAVHDGDQHRVLAIHDRETARAARADSGPGRLSCQRLSLPDRAPRLARLRSDRHEPCSARSASTSTGCHRRTWRRMVPFVNQDGLRAATFCASDGLIDPHGVTSALWDEARRLGAWLLPDTEVLDVTTSATGVVVRTSSGEISAEYAVNAAGPYAASARGDCRHRAPGDAAPAQPRVHRGHRRPARRRADAGRQRHRGAHAQRGSGIPHRLLRSHRPAEPRHELRPRRSSTRSPRASAIASPSSRTRTSTRASAGPASTRKRPTTTPSSMRRRRRLGSSSASASAATGSCTRSLRVRPWRS